MSGYATANRAGIGLDITDLQSAGGYRYLSKQSGLWAYVRGAPACIREGAERERVMMTHGRLPR